MRERTPRTLLPLAAAFALACALLAPAAARASQQTKKPPPPDSTVYGRVVYDDTSRPVRRARVMLVDESGSRPEYNALTDADGGFRIEHVRAGFYFAFVDIPGVLSPISLVRATELRGRNKPDFTEVRKFFDMVEVDGKQDSRVTVRARRGAALSGRVTYADGDPAVNVSVNLMRRGPDGRLEKFLPGLSLTSLAGFKTDDRGVFRQSGLPPGEYVIAVSEQTEHGDENNEGGTRDPTLGVFESLAGQQFLTTFYPSATSAKDAVVVTAEAGVERSGLDITIPERALHTVGGVVRGKSDKRPVKGAGVYIASREDGMGAGSPFPADRFAGNNATTTDAEGRWEFREIPEGSYTVNIKPPEGQEAEPSDGDATSNRDGSSDGSVNSNYAHMPAKKRGYAPASRDFEVIESDVSDVAVELNDGARVSGTIAYEGDKQQGYGYFSLRRVPGGAEASRAYGLSDGWSAFVSDNRFDVAGLPAGKYFVQFNAHVEDSRAYVKSITWNGRDIMREPLELAEGASAEGIVVTISTNPSRLRVRAAGGLRKAAMRGVMVTLLPPDLTRWSPDGQQFSCFTEDDGSCVIDAPPGEYLVVALRASIAAGAFEQELGRRALAAPRVTLAAGETRDFEVALPEK